MRKVQEKLMELIENEVLEYKEDIKNVMNETIEVIDDPRYANLGNLLIQVRFKTLLKIHYSFQPEHAEFILTAHNCPEEKFIVRYEKEKDLKQFFASLGLTLENVVSNYLE